jgi:hypothetical protein
MARSDRNGKEYDYSQRGAYFVTICTRDRGLTPRPRGEWLSGVEPFGNNGRGNVRAKHPLSPSMCARDRRKWMLRPYYPDAKTVGTFDWCVQNGVDKTPEQVMPY